MNDVRSQLDEYFSYVDAEQGSVDVFDVVENVEPLPIESVPYRRSGRGGWRVAAAAAALVLILVGGLALLARVMNDSEDAPVVDDPVVTTTQPAVTSTTVADASDEAPITGGSETPGTTPWSIEDIPADAESGVVDTPLGPAHWLHLTGGTTAVPGHVWGMEALAWPAGFAIFQPPFYTYVGDREELHPASLWVSPDGIEWQVEPLPIDPAAVEASLTLDGGAYWLTSTDPNALWRSPDGAIWHEYVPRSLAPPGPSWDSALSGSWLDGARLASTGELTVSYVTFSDDHGGSNTTPDHAVERLYLIGESTIERVDVPWPTFSKVNQGYNFVSLFGAEDWIYAYVVTETSADSADLVVWRTNDGRSWTDLGPLSVPDQPRSHAVRFATAGDTLTITFFDTSSAGSEHDTAWQTTDGVNWTPLPSGRPEDTHPLRVESGWFSTVGDQGGRYGGQAWWMNAGDTWVPLEDLSANQFCDGSTITAVDNTTFISGRGCAADLWILHLDRSN